MLEKIELKVNVKTHEFGAGSDHHEVAMIPSQNDRARFVGTLRTHNSVARFDRIPIDLGRGRGSEDEFGVGSEAGSQLGLSRGCARRRRGRGLLGRRRGDHSDEIAGKGIDQSDI